MLATLATRGAGRVPDGPRQAHRPDQARCESAGPTPTTRNGNTSPRITPAPTAGSFAMTRSASSAERARKITMPNVEASVVWVRPKRSAVPAAASRALPGRGR